MLVGFRGSPSDPTWLVAPEIETLVGAKPDANIEALDVYPDNRGGPGIHRSTPVPASTALPLPEARLCWKPTRGSAAPQAVGFRSVRVEPNLPADVLGVYVYLPRPGAGVERMSRSAPPAIRTVGGLLPRDTLDRIAQGDDELDGTDQSSYHVPQNERLGERIDSAWSRMRVLWEAFRQDSADLGQSEHQIGATRNQWLLPLFETLGFGRLQPSTAVEIEGKSFPISHFWERVPIHLVGAGMSIDRRTPGAPGGAKAAPHSLVQEFLNRSDDHLWAIVSNGLLLRILRDNDALSRQAFVEFDLAAILEGELYSDFRLLWLICHESRLEGEVPEECWLEKWFAQARDQGVRALDALREGVEKGIQALGAGFLRHPANDSLQKRLSSDVGAADQYYRELLRLIYRMIFLFVAEDREVLLDPEATSKATGAVSTFLSVLAASRAGRPKTRVAPLGPLARVADGHGATRRGERVVGAAGAGELLVEPRRGPMDR